MINRQEIAKKNHRNFSFINEREAMTAEAEQFFAQTPNATIQDYSKIKLGVKYLEDAVYNLSDLKKVNTNLADKGGVLTAINNQDYKKMIAISNFFYNTSGIYNRLCRYMAYMYRYDWLVTPYINSSKLETEKILGDFNKALQYLDNFSLKKFFGEVALKVIRTGSYYGYIIPSTTTAAVQELPVGYCRSRFSVAGRPAVEFNMRFFDENFRDTEQRNKMLNLFPEEFKKGYVLYKKGKLPPQFMGDISGWYLLDSDYAVKFNLNGEDFPPFISVIPAILDLDAAQGLERKKMEQQLLKIVIQKIPLDKNGELLFDPEEIRDVHNSAVRMLSRGIGLDVLTSFADIDVADMNSNAGNTAADNSMDRVKAAVFDQAGVSQMQFNTDGNLALEKSVLNDEASMYNLIQQFEEFINQLLTPFNKNPKKIFYRAQILGTTINNYKELAKLYKEQTQLGYSKMLPQIALGQSQSSILASTHFENDILDLVHVFIPPLSSNTMNADILNRGQQGTESGQDGAGRPEKSDDEKSTKTIQNKESMS